MYVVSANWINQPYVLSELQEARESLKLYI